MIKSYINCGINIVSSKIEIDESLCKLCEIDTDIFGTVTTKNSQKLKVIYFLDDKNQCKELEFESKDFLFNKVQEIVNFDYEVGKNLCHIYRLGQDNENYKLLFRKETEKYEYDINNPWGEKENYEKLKREDFDNEDEWDYFQAWKAGGLGDYFGCSKLVNIVLPKYGIDKDIILTCSYRGDENLAKEIKQDLTNIERVYVFAV